jgi:hypothetical protein
LFAIRLFQSHDLRIMLNGLTRVISALFYVLIFN